MRTDDVDGVYRVVEERTSAFLDSSTVQRDGPLGVSLDK